VVVSNLQIFSEPATYNTLPTTTMPCAEGQNPKSSRMIEPSGLNAEIKPKLLPALAPLVMKY